MIVCVSVILQEIRQRSYRFDVSLNDRDEDIALMSKAFIEMSVQRYFKFPIECDIVIINPIVSINVIIETLQSRPC